MTRTRPHTLRWLLVATVVEAVCALVFWLPLLRGLDQWLDFAWPGLLLLRILAVAVVPVLMYAVWREQAGHTVVTQESADLMVAALSTSREWLWAVDLAGVFTFCSRASRELVGYEASELLGQPCNVVMDLSELARARSEMQALGGRESGWAGLAVRCRHRDGSTIWVESAGRPRNDRAGRIVGFEGTNRSLGPEAVHTVATEHTKARVEAMLAQRLLLTAFQPICDLKNGGVVGVEALTRFVAEPGVTPDVWFAEAGSVGLGIELELLAVQTALETAALLPGRLYVSVNASPSACLDPRLAGLLEQCPIVTGRIVLELTEHAAVTDYEPLTAALASLRRVGVRIAVDDAGAGYASFRHILRLKPDLIKLDRDIVAGIDTDPARHALGAAVVTFAAQIGARVIAEGIQTSAELATVTGLGMAGGQGYLLGRPSIEAREFQRWQPATRSRRQAAI